MSLAAMYMSLRLVGRVAGDGLVYDGLGLGRLGFTAHGLSSSNRLAWPRSYSKTEMHERERPEAHRVSGGPGSDLPHGKVTSTAFFEPMQGTRSAHVQSWGNRCHLLISRDAKSPDKRFGKREGCRIEAHYMC